MGTSMPAWADIKGLSVEAEEDEPVGYASHTLSAMPVTRCPL
jgi:hypothetical protein